jgi:hypothetical protein
MEDCLSRRNWLAIVMVIIALAASSSGNNAAFASDKKGTAGTVEKRPGKLNREEEIFLRNHIYRDGSVVCSLGKCEEDSSGQMKIHLSGLKVLHVPERVVSIHKAKRVAVLRLLRDIVRGGSPRDALRAIAVAVALEQGAGMAEPYVYFPIDTMDDTPDGDTQSRRERFVEQIQAYLSTAQKLDKK